MDDVEFQQKFSRLQLLLERGVLSNEQFEKKKEELVDLFVMGQDIVMQKMQTKEKEDTVINSEDSKEGKKKLNKGHKTRGTSKSATSNSVKKTEKTTVADGEAVVEEKKLVKNSEHSLSSPDILQQHIRKERSDDDVLSPRNSPLTSLGDSTKGTITQKNQENKGNEENNLMSEYPNPYATTINHSQSQPQHIQQQLEQLQQQLQQQMQLQQFLQNQLQQQLQAQQQQSPPQQPLHQNQQQPPQPPQPHVPDTSAGMDISDVSMMSGQVSPVLPFVSNSPPALRPKYIVVFAFTPEVADELELVVGDIVYVTNYFDDGWVKGTSDRGVGIFPLNYVQPVPHKTSFEKEVFTERSPSGGDIDKTLSASDSSDVNATPQMKADQKINMQLSQLSEAVWDGNLYEVKQLSKNFSTDKINKFRNSRGQSIMYCACRQGNYQIVRFLLARGCDYLSPQESKGSTPLHGACFGGSQSTVALLLALPRIQTIVDKKNSFGNTPFDEVNATVSEVVKNYKEKGVSSLYPYLSNWSGYVTTTFHFETRVNWPTNDISKSIFHIHVHLSSYDKTELARFDQKVLFRTSTYVADKEFKVLLGGFKSHDITCKIDVLHGRSKNQKLTKWATGEVTFPASNGTKKVCCGLIHYVSSGIFEGFPSTEPPSSFIDLTFNFLELDEEDMKEETLQCSERMGMKIYQFYKLHDSIRLLIEAYQKKNLMHLYKGTASGIAKPYLKIQKARKGYQVGQNIKIQQDVSAFSYGPIDRQQWGTKYKILQMMPDFQAEFALAKARKVVVETVSFTDFMQEHVISNNEWCESYLLGECIWFVADERKIEELSFRML